MNIIQRVAALHLPSDKFVVISSGILDALGLRSAKDIDLVAEPSLFELLRSSGEWTEQQKHGEPVLYSSNGEVEVWLSWGSGGKPNFADLYRDSVVIGGIHFTSPQRTIIEKRKMNRPKDVADIALLETYIRTHS